MFEHTNVVVELLVVVGYRRVPVLTVCVKAPLASADEMWWLFFKLEVEHHSLDVTQKEYGVLVLRYCGAVGYTNDLVLKYFTELNHDEGVRLMNTFLKDVLPFNI